MDTHFPRLGQMIIDYDAPIKKMTEEFIPLSKVCVPKEYQPTCTIYIYIMYIILYVLLYGIMYMTDLGPLGTKH